MRQPVRRRPVADHGADVDRKDVVPVAGRDLLLAAGSAGMAVAPGEDSTQGWLAVTSDAVAPASTTLHLVDADGVVVATFVTSKATRSVVFSSPAVSDGATYTLTSGGTASGTSTGGLAETGELGTATTVGTAGQAGAGGLGGGRPPR